MGLRSAGKTRTVWLKHTIRAVAWGLVVWSAIACTARDAQARVWVLTFGENQTAIDLQLDPFYSAVGYGLSLSDEEPDLLDASEEEGILSYLIDNFTAWRSARFEISINPLPLVGVSVKSYARDFYNKMALMPEFNIVESLTEGFPDPGAFSIFLGNKVFLVDYDIEELKGFGYGGLLLNMGYYHILRNTLIDDFWMEAEAKVKVSMLSEERENGSSYRVGFRAHSRSPEIRNAVYIGFKRDRTDRDYFGWSPLKNSEIDFRLDVNTVTWEVSQFQTIIGKKVPSEDGEYVYSLSLGFLMQRPQAYGESLQELFAEGREGVTGAVYTFLVRPNIIF